MAISAVNSVIQGGGGHSNRASIERQIRRLEEKKRELMEKLGGGGGGGGDQDAAELSRGTLAVGGQSSSVQGESLGASLGQAIRNFSQSLAEPPEMPDGDENDPKEIMKKIQLIDMQIMMLRRQLGDDGSLGLEPLENDADNAAAMATAGIEEQIAGVLSSGGETGAAGAGEGHVDVTV